MGDRVRGLVVEGWQGRMGGWGRRLVVRVEGLVVGGGKWEEKNRDRVMGFNSGKEPF